MLDRLGVLLAGDGAGLLRAEPHLVQHPRDVPRMVFDAEPLLNHPGDPLTGPQLGGEPRFEWPRHDQIDQLVPLFIRELTLGPGVWLSGEGVFAPFTPCPAPPLGGRRVDAEAIGYRADGLPCLEARRSATTASFQLRRTACGSHEP